MIVHPNSLHVLREIKFSYETTIDNNFRVRTYDGSTMVHEEIADSQQEAHGKSVEWVYKNYNVVESATFYVRGS